MKKKYPAACWPGLLLILSLALFSCPSSQQQDGLSKTGYVRASIGILEQVRDLVEKGEVPQASEHLKSGLQQFPEDAGLLYALSAIFAETGKLGTPEHLANLEEAYKMYFQFEKLAENEDYIYIKGKRLLLIYGIQEEIYALAVRCKGLAYTEAMITGWIESQQAEPVRFFDVIADDIFLVRAQVRTLQRKNKLAREDMAKALEYFKKNPLAYLHDKQEALLKEVIGNFKEKSPVSFEEITDAYSPVGGIFGDTLNPILKQLFEGKKELSGEEDGRPAAPADSSLKDEQQKFYVKSFLIWLEEALEIEETRVSSLKQVCSRAEPVIQAIEKYKETHGCYPGTLADISKEDTVTGLLTRPSFEYCRENNYYDLRVAFSWGPLGDVILLYRPEEGRSDYVDCTKIAPHFDALEHFVNGWVILLD